MAKPITEFDLLKILTQFREKEFYGKLTIEFNHGQPKLVRIEETQIIQQGETPNECKHN